MSFGDAASRAANVAIFETIYHAALEASCELAERDGCYESYEGSPVSKGLLQQDMWDAPATSGHWDWSVLRARSPRTACATPFS